MSDISDDCASRIVCNPRPRAFTAPTSGKARCSALSAALPALLALGLFGAPQAQAAAQRTSGSPALADFKQLSGARATTCSAPEDALLAGLGAPSARHCAWSQHIEMLYWEQLPGPRDGCLPAPAVAWHRLGAGARAAVPPWDAAWTGQAFTLQAGGLQQAGALWRRADGAWSAVLWRWRPSSRLATRNWQAGQWDKVRAAARAIQAEGATRTAAPHSLLTTAWLDASRGKPRLVEADALRWISAGACLSLRTAGNGSAQLHLPYSRDDARLEQRSAMQVQLARRFPAAEWLRPFTLLEPGSPGARSGAKFVAVWKEGAALQGQLWITLRDDAGIVRARIASALPAGQGDAVKERALLLERELTALAHAWEARHE